MQKKIPDHAKLVFKGVLFDTYQWQQEMFDGSFAAFEAIRRKDLVCIIAVTNDNKIIINYEQQPNSKDFISIPGGRMEEGEDPLVAAKREFLEETGYTSSDWKFLYTVDILNNNKIDWEAHFFIAKNSVKTNDSSLDSGEKIETREITFEELCILLDDPRLREIYFLKKLKEVKNDPEKLEEFRKMIFE